VKVAERNFREGGVRLDEECLRLLRIGSRAAGSNRRSGRQKEERE
jgi:hypothetical protein